MNASFLLTKELWKANDDSSVAYEKVVAGCTRKTVLLYFKTKI